MSIKSLNPTNGSLIAEFEPSTDQEINVALAAAESAVISQRMTSFSNRADCMHSLADRLDATGDELSRLITDEMGKTITAARAEVEKCAWVCRYYAENAESMLASVQLESDASYAAVHHRPLGILLAVMPWNFPAWQVFRAAIPAIMAGNVVLLKHASNVPRTALRLQQLFEVAGFDRGVFQTLLIGPDHVARLLADDRIRAAKLTGSMRAGASVASIAGKNLKKVVLELGGSDPFIVMPSAQLDDAVETAVTARTLNNGQSCIAAKRFIVHTDVLDAFIDGFVGRFEALKVGDPTDENTEIGPLAMEHVRDRLASQVQTLIERGAERVTGAEVMKGEGYFYRPGVLCGLSADAPPFDEELFGPVAWVLPVSSIDEALALANATRYGLGSAIWTQDRSEISRAIDELECGATFVNDMVKSDPRMPFGGTRDSGHGRELARDGILEFVNRKTVVITSN